MAINKKYCGVFPAFYACYDNNNNICSDKTKEFTQYLIHKKVHGVYVCGSSGECIYQSVEERMKTLESVMKVAKGKITVIAHVACNNTKDSMLLAKHAEQLGVDAIAAIPPIYFRLPDYAIAEYWNSISNAAPNTDFIIYNIPQLAGVALTTSLLKEMLKNPRVVAVKNSSMPTFDIQSFKAIGGDDFVVFNGPDEQFVSGLAIGASGGIGGTYAVMPELFLKAYEHIKSGDISKAQQIQFKINQIISDLCSCHGSMYAVIKEILRINEGIDIGTVRPPLPQIIDKDMKVIQQCANLIKTFISE